MKSKVYFFIFSIAFFFACSPISHTEPQKENTQVLVEGENVWPPQGPRCDKFIDCCVAAEKKDPSTQLMCRLIAAKKPLDCAEGIRTIAQYMKEKKMEPPPECIEVRMDIKM